VVKGSGYGYRHAVDLEAGTVTRVEANNHGVHNAAQDVVYHSKIGATNSGELSKATISV
jgi:hypothetical protein